MVYFVGWHIVSATYKEKTILNTLQYNTVQHCESTEHLSNWSTPSQQAGVANFLICIF